MLTQRLLLTLLIIIPTTHAAASGKAKLALDSATFVCQVSRMIHGQLGNQAGLRLRRAAEIFGALAERKLGAVPPLSEPWGLAEYYSTAYQTFHSISLLDGEPAPAAGQINWSNLLDYEVNQASLQRPPPDLVHEEGLLERLSPIRISKDVILIPGELSVRDRQANLFVSRKQNLVKWLIEQRPFSVTPLDLVVKATELTGGDTLTALGILGQLFDNERHGPSKPRSHLAVLGSRLSSYFSNGREHIGANYHFWVYLNLTLVRPTAWASWMSWAYEKHLQGDLYEYLVDQAGISAGYQIRAALLNPRDEKPNCN